MEVLSNSTISLLRDEKVRNAIRELLEKETGGSVQVRVNTDHPREVTLERAST